MGCVVSTLIGVMWCRKGCSASELAGEFAYFPPSPSSYAVERTADNNLVCKLNPFYFPAYGVSSLTRTRAQVVELSSHGGVRIPAFFFRRLNASITLLYSHSNAVDCGFLYRYFEELSDRLGVNILGYEYSGYGPTAQAASARNHTQRADVLAAYEHLLARGINPARQVIAYGQSIGSYPALFAASRHRFLGVVLHSPIAAGLQVITRIDGCCAPHRVYACLEPYPNASLVQHVRDPVLILHGTADETVDCAHGRRLHGLCAAEARYEPYWAEGATHEDVIEVDAPEFFNRMRRFFTYCEARAAKADSSAASDDGEGASRTPSATAQHLQAQALALAQQTPVLTATSAHHPWDMRPVAEPRMLRGGAGCAPEPRAKDRSDVAVAGDDADSAAAPACPAGAAAAAGVDVGATAGSCIGPDEIRLGLAELDLDSPQAQRGPCSDCGTRRKSAQFGGSGSFGGGASGRNSGGGGGGGGSFGGAEARARSWSMSGLSARMTLSPRPAESGGSRPAALHPAAPITPAPVPGRVPRVHADAESGANGTAQPLPIMPPAAGSWAACATAECHVAPAAAEHHQHRLREQLHGAPRTADPPPTASPLAQTASLLQPMASRPPS